MTRTHLVVVNDGNNVDSHGGLEYACTVFPEDTIVAIYVDTAGGGPRSIRSNETSTLADDWIESHHEAAGVVFDDARVLAEGHGVSLETVVAFGRLADTVERYCAEHDVDTVIVGCADRDAFSSYISADDVTRIANTASVPVVVV